MMMTPICWYHCKVSNKQEVCTFRELEHIGCYLQNLNLLKNTQNKNDFGKTIS